MVYAPKSEQIALCENLASLHPSIMKSEIIGYTVLNRPIRMYRIGNPQGGKVLFDGQIHGGSDISTWVLYYYAKWLAESGDPVANDILQKNCTLIVPIVNVDMDTRKNARGGSYSTGVDLNRNFVYNWQNGGSTTPSDDYYRGPSPASEPETQAMINLFNTEGPKFYLNMHNWGGPWIGSYSLDSQKRVYNDSVRAKIAALAQRMGVFSYPYNSNANLGAGFAVSDAYQSGIPSTWIIEMVKISDYPSQRPPFAEIESLYFPRFKPIAITFSQEVEAAVTRKLVFQQWDDGDTNPVKTIIA